MGGIYVPRSPATGLLYGVVRGLAGLRSGGPRTDAVGLPAFVAGEFGNSSIAAFWRTALAGRPAHGGAAAHLVEPCCRPTCRCDSGCSRCRIDCAIVSRTIISSAARCSASSCGRCARRSVGRGGGVGFEVARAFRRRPRSPHALPYDCARRGVRAAGRRRARISTRGRADRCRCTARGAAGPPWPGSPRARRPACRRPRRRSAERGVECAGGGDAGRGARAGGAWAASWPGAAAARQGSGGPVGGPAGAPACPRGRLRSPRRRARTGRRPRATPAALPLSRPAAASLRFVCPAPAGGRGVAAAAVR
jgi:hypothetical protein